MGGGILCILCIVPSKSPIRERAKILARATSTRHVIGPVGARKLGWGRGAPEKRHGNAFKHSSRTAVCPGKGKQEVIHRTTDSRVNSSSSVDLHSRSNYVLGLIVGKNRLIGQDFGAIMEKKYF